MIAAYPPKPGHEAALLELARDHTPFLQRLGFATEAHDLFATFVPVEQ